MRHPLVVHPDRRKAVRGVVAALGLAVVCVLAGASEEEYEAVMLLVGIAWAGFFVLGALKLAQTARSREPVLVVDEDGIRSPANGVRVLWSDVVAVDHERGRTRFDMETHTLRVSVWGGRVDIDLDDLSMPPDAIAAAVQERFRTVAPARAA